MFVSEYILYYALRKTMLRTAALRSTNSWQRQTAAGAFRHGKNFSTISGTGTETETGQQISESLSSAETLSATATESTWLNIQLLQDTMSLVHESTGLPWWASIVATTMAVRVVMFPVAPYQMRAAMTMSIIRPKLEAAAAEFRAKQNPQPSDVTIYRTKTKAVFKEHNVSPFSSFLPILLQSPILMTFFFTLRSPTFPVRYPEFTEGGCLWFTDLSVMDPHYILPVLSAVSFLTVLELGSEGVATSQMTSTMKNLMRGMILTMIPACYWMPSGVFVYWITNSYFSLFQGKFLKLGPVRRFFGIPDPRLLTPGKMPSAQETLRDRLAKDAYIPDKVYTNKPRKPKNI